MKGADLVSDFVIKMGMPVVFGVSGANCEDVFDSLHKNGKTKIILSKSEYGAAAMAIGHYLAHKKTGMVVTTSGPGILNTIPVLAEAYTSRIPLIVLAGSVPLEGEGNGAFQDTSGKNGSLSLESMLSPCTCFVRKILSEEQFAETLQTAYEKSLRHKRPAVVILPRDMAKKEIYSVSEFYVIQEEERSVERAEVEEGGELRGFCEEMLKKENRPLIVLGEDVVHLKERTFLQQFLDNMNAPVIVTPNAKGVIDHSLKYFSGLMGIMGHEQALAAFKKASHVLFIGFQSTALNMIGIQEDYAGKKKFSFNTLPGNSDELLSALVKTLKTGEKRELPSVLPEKMPEEKRRKGFVPENILSVIQNHFSRDLNIFVDAGNTGAWVVHHFKCSGQGLFSISLGMGGMGNSIGAAIGAAAQRLKRSIVFAGDGSFLIQGLEIHTALQYAIPVTIFILNNNAHEMCATRERLFLEGETGLNRFKPSFYANGILKMFPGLPAREIYSLEELEECLNDFKSVRGPVVISINLSDSDNPPFLTFKGGQT